MLQKAFGRPSFELRPLRADKQLTQIYYDWKEQTQGKGKAGLDYTTFFYCQQSMLQQF